MRDLSHRRRSRVPRLLVLLLALLALAGVAALAAAALRSGPAPRIEIVPALPAIGQRTPIAVTVAEPSRGLAGVTVELVQGERRYRLAEQRFAPRPAWALWGNRTPRLELALAAGRELQADLTAGEATVRVTAERAGAWLRRPAPAVAEVALPVRLSPPALQVLSIQTYLAQGGSEAVVYRVGPTAVRSGVRAGSWFFPGHPLPGGGADERFALFAAPYDLDDARAIRLVASDEVSNEARVAFVDRFTPRRVPTGEIRLDDRFLAKVVPEILAATPAIADRGDPLASYLAINGELRRANADELVALAGRSRAEFLWRQPFTALPGGKVMSPFAERRSYLYGGREVDEQVHLGYDLASVRKAPVPAANRGVVLLARYFGIYGNTVVVDHGYGLMSLYSHLSSIAVAEGETVERGAILGATGETGLAGGDHLHFSFLLAGLPIDPVEWWDAAWIRNRIGRKLGAALPFADR